ncbi:DUF2461 domain-containing protein [bacterium]|nr:DUF2461 domain-containing protein [bacterium]
MSQDAAAMAVPAGQFAGFPKQAIKFYKDIAANNDQQWFEAHRQDYLDYVVAPAQAFVEEMGARLKGISPGINANPDPNGRGSIKKIHLDRRFNPSRAPHRTWLGIMFWEGPLKAKKDNTAYYLRLSPSELSLAVGIKQFQRPQLKAFRDSVVDKGHGAALLKAIKTVGGSGDYQLGGSHYKKQPQGYESEGEKAGLLLYNGLYYWTESKGLPKEVYSAELLDYCFERFEDMSPVHQWLAGMLERTA